MLLNISDHDLDLIANALQELPIKVAGPTWDRLRAEVERVRRDEEAKREATIDARIKAAVAAAQRDAQET